VTATAFRRRPRVLARHPDLALSGILFAALLGLFVAVQRGVVVAIDGKIMYHVAQALAHGRLSITAAADPTPNNHPYSNYGIGLSLVEVPFYLIQRALNPRGLQVMTLVNPVLLAAAGAVVYAVGRQLGFGRPSAAGAGLILGWLTMALQATRELQTECGVICWTAVFVLGLLRWRAGARGGPLLAGLGLAMCLLFRTDSIVTVAAAALVLPFLIRPRDLLRRPGALGLFLVPALLAVGWTMYYSELRSGSPIPVNYAGKFNVPYLVGLRDLYLSRGKSFFIYNPFLLLALPGGVLLWLRDRAATLLLVLLVVVRALVFAHNSNWGSDYSWGPRYLTETVLPMSLLAAYAVARLARVRPGALRAVGWLATAVLGAAGLAVNLASVWLGVEVGYAAAIRRPGGPGAAAYRFSFAHGSLGYVLQQFPDTARLSLEHFRPGPTAVGLAALATAVAGSVLALGLARVLDRRSSGSTAAAGRPTFLAARLARQP
jgi:hypothetical protein